MMDSSPDAILPILIQLGCPGIDHVSSVSAFDTQQLVSAVIVLLQNINSQLISHLPSGNSVPRGNAARFRLCSDIANVITQQLGFNGDLGYQTFLYPNPNETRNLLVFLLDKLPRSNADSPETISVGNLSMSARIAKVLENSSSKKKLWNPLSSSQNILNSTHYRQAKVPLSFPFGPDSREFTWYVKEAQKSVCSQIRTKLFACSLLNRIDEDLIQQQELEYSLLRGEEMAAAKLLLQSRNDAALKAAGEAMNNSKSKMSTIGEILQSYKGFSVREGKTFTNSSTFSRRKMFEDEVMLNNVELLGANGVVSKISLLDGQKIAANTQSREEEMLELQRKREQQLALLREELLKYHEGIKKSEEYAQKIANEVKMMEEKLESESKATSSLEDAVRTKGETLALLPNADENIRKLTQLSESAKERLKALGEEWENIRGPLQAQIDAAKQTLNDRREDCKRKVLLLKNIRMDMASMVQQIRQKDQLLKQLLDEYNSMPKSTNRQVYVRMIMDIVKNLQKQKTEIERVLADIRTLQRDINSVSEVSKRSSLLVKDMMFRTAKSDAGGLPDPTLTQTLESIISFEKTFDELVDGVAEIGKTKSEGRDVSNKIDVMDMGALDAKLRQVRGDLEGVQAENAALMMKLR